MPNTELVVTEEQKQLVSIQNYETQANAMVLVTKDDAQKASDFAGNMTQAIKRVEEVRKAIIAPAKKALDEYTLQANEYCKPTIYDMEQAKAVALVKIAEWQAKEQERINAENAERERKAREAAQKAEKEAAAVRAKEEEKRKQLEEEARIAEERRKKAEEKGDKKLAREQAEKAAKLAAEAINTEVNAEHTVAEIHTKVGAAHPAPTPAKETTKIKGMATRDSWSAMMMGFSEEEAKLTLIKAAATGDRPELAAFLNVNMTSLNQTARALKKNFNVPGFKAVNNPKPVGAKR